MVKTFAELQNTEAPDPQDVVDTLEDHAKGGWAIKGDVVINIIDGAKLSRDALQACLAAAEKGGIVHMNMSRKATEPGKPAAEESEAMQYMRVAAYIRQLFMDLTTENS